MPPWRLRPADAGRGAGRVSAGRVEVRCPESPSDPRTASAAPAGSRAASVPWPQPWQSRVWFFFSFNVVRLGTHSTADRVLTRKSPWPWEPLVVQGFLQARVRDLRVVVPDSGGWSTRPDGVGILGGGVTPFLVAPPFPRHLDIQGREDGGRQGELADPGCPDARPWGTSNDGATRPFFYYLRNSHYFLHNSHFFLLFLFIFYMKELRETLKTQIKVISLPTPRRVVLSRRRQICTQ